MVIAIPFPLSLLTVLSETMLRASLDPRVSIGNLGQKGLTAERIYVYCTKTSHALLGMINIKNASFLLKQYVSEIAFSPHDISDSSTSLLPSPSPPSPVCLSGTCQRLTQ